MKNKYIALITLAIIVIICLCTHYYIKGYETGAEDTEKLHRAWGISTQQQQQNAFRFLSN